MDEKRGRSFQRGNKGPSFGRARTTRRAPEGAPAPGDAPSRPSDPRVCRHCGERVLDMKYHLAHVHPRPSPRERARQPHLDPATSDALGQVVSTLEEARELVFKEPVRAIALVDRAREVIAWMRDPTKGEPPGRPAAAPPRPTTGKRVEMRATPRKPHDQGPW
jgi:hypothetical protein